MTPAPKTGRPEGRPTSADAAALGDPETMLPVDPAAPAVEMPVQPGHAPRGPRPKEAPAGVAISYEQFGRHFVRRVVHLDRVLATIDGVLGPTIEIGPIGAGPGRAFASVSVLGRFSGTSGHEIPADLLTYAIDLPISVTFTLDLPVDTLTFNAEVVLPLVLVVRTEAPATIRMDIAVPEPDQVQLDIQPSTRRGAVFQRVTGLESELRRFLIKVVRTELSKPYIQRATCLDMEKLIEDHWDTIERSLLPQSPEDRKR